MVTDGKRGEGSADDIPGVPREQALVQDLKAGSQGAAVAGIAVPTRFHWRGALGVGRAVRGEPGSKVD